MSHTVEWRIVCNRHGDPRFTGDRSHHDHVHLMPTQAKAEAAVARNNASSLFLDPVPGRIGCLPWRAEHRVITEWQA